MANVSMIGETARSKDQLDPSSILAPALEEFTRSVFFEAGLAPGMRILDLCSGSGDVAFLAQEIVGETGSVTGFDNPPGLVAYANERAAYRSLANVQFVEGGFNTVSFAEPFDAIVGRLVLMYREDPEADISAVLRFLRPGGLIVLQELDLLAATTVPTAREIERTREWIRDICNVAGMDPQMGPKLHPTLSAQGLIDVQMRVDGLIGGADSLLPKLVSQIAETLAPLHPLGTDIENQVQMPTLEETMRAELAETGGVMSTALLISAWARLPS